MFNVGDWVDYTLDNGKSKRAFVMVAFENFSTIQIVGMPSKKSVYHVPNIRLSLPFNTIHPQDKEMLVDMALAINDRDWFHSLTGSLSATL